MALRNQRAVWISFAIITIAFSNVWQSRAAEADDPAAAIQAHLQFGEFGPARQLAERLDDRNARDAQLALVAASQAKVGARDASLATVGLMSDDRARAGALDDVRDALQGPRGNAGGVQADFTSLMDLITSTVAPTSWDEVGGPGSMSPFRTGVHVDGDGVLRRVMKTENAPRVALVVREAASPRAETLVSQPSELRKISLTRLEKAVQLKLAAGQEISEEMRMLAGLSKIRYVMVYPETGDLVIAGPAGDWKTTAEARVVSATNGRPVVQLDDLVVILRHMSHGKDTTFGCSITPKAESLARTRDFVEESNKTPIKSGRRDAWLAKLRKNLGRQTIEVFGLDPHTRAAQVLVEGDYRMKLVGMGLEEGTLGVTSYLDSIHLAKGEPAPPMDVLRWWFTMNYKAVMATADRDGYELRGPGVQVQCENEFINKNGEQIHTGQASAMNQQFAHSFTEHFAALAQKYPVYADMQNLFDLALVAALVNSEGLADRVGWHQTCFADAKKYQVALGVAPKEVDTVMNHRVVNQSVILVGVSGGVDVNPWSLVQTSSIDVDKYGKLKAEHSAAAAKQDLDANRWWWD